MEWWFEIISVLLVYFKPTTADLLYLLALFGVMVFSYVLHDQLILKAYSILYPGQSWFLNVHRVVEAPDDAPEEEPIGVFPNDEDIEDISEEDMEFMDLYPQLVGRQFEYQIFGTPQITLDNGLVEILDDERKRVLECLKQMNNESGDSPFKCNSCLRKFSIHPSRVPRMLYCGHTFCTKCITVFIISTREHFLTCPDCTLTTSLNRFKPIANDLNVNHALADLMKSNFWGSFSSSTALKCPRCQIPFNSRYYEQNSRVSPVCGHSTCELCIREMLVVYDKFKCGTCNEIIIPEEPWEELFPYNFTVMEALAVVYR